MIKTATYIFLFFFPVLVRAGDTVSLRMVHIASGLSGTSGEKLSHAGIPPGASFSELLAAQGICNIREYAPGGISAVSIRGGNAQQTQVCWNGLPINSQFVGMMDVSLLPAGFFQASTLHPRMEASAAGGISGTIDLKEDPASQSQVNATLLGGNFGRKLFSADVTQVQKKFSWYTKTQLLDDPNRFAYKAFAEAPVEYMAHAGIKSFQALYGFQVKNGFWFRAWHSLVHREISPTLQQSSSLATQQDESHRFAIGYNLSSGSWTHRLTLGSFTDHIRYADPSILLLAPATSLQAGLVWQSEHRSGFTAGVLAQYIVAHNNGYSGARYVQRCAPSMGYSFTLVPQKLFLQAGTFADIRITTAPAWNATAALHYLFYRHNRVFVSAARVKRFPTLNDLYWVPGGNTNLLPEEGFEYEGGIALAIIREMQRFEWNSSVFYRDLSRQITWLPELSNWKAVNLLETRTYGHQFRGTYSLNMPNSRLLQASVSGIYQRSTNRGGSGLQQVYIPGLQFTAQLSYKTIQGTLGLRMNHTSLRYVTSDGQTFIPPFRTYDAWMETPRKRVGRRIQFVAGLVARNLSNTLYQYVYQRPMALRNFFLTIHTYIN